MKFFTLILFFICQASYGGTADQRLYKAEIKKHKLSIELRAIGGIGRKEAATLKLDFFDMSKGKRSAVKLEKKPEAFLWMMMKGGHGHGSENLSITEENKSFILSNAWFLMMGEWQLKIKVFKDGKVDNVILPICVERKIADSHVGKCGF